MPHGLFQLVIPAISLGSVSCCDTYTALVDPAAPGVDSSAVEGKTAAVAAAAVTFPNVEVDGSDRVFGRTPAATGGVESAADAFGSSSLSMYDTSGSRLVT